MSSLTTAILRREFRYQGATLPDPGPAVSPEQVRELITATNLRYKIRNPKK